MTTILSLSFVERDVYNYNHESGTAAKQGYIIVMNWNDLINVIKEGENNTKKFFGQVRSLDDIGSTIIAMANTKGGDIFIGMDIKNYHLYGFSSSIDTIQELIQTHCRPKITITTDNIEKNNKTIWIIHIKDNQNKPYYYKNMCYIMDGKEPRLALVEKTNTPVIKKEDPSLSIATDAFKIQKKNNHSLDEQTTIQTALDIQSSHYASPDQQTTYTLEDLENITNELTLLKNKREKDEKTESESNLNSRQTEALEYVLLEESIKNKDYRDLFSVSHKTAHLELVDMVSRGLLSPSGQGRNTHYVVVK